MGTVAVTCNNSTRSYMLCVSWALKTKVGYWNVSWGVGVSSLRVGLFCFYTAVLFAWMNGCFGSCSSTLCGWWHEEYIQILATLSELLLYSVKRRMVLTFLMALTLLSETWKWKNILYCTAQLFHSLRKLHSSSKLAFHNFLCSSFLTFWVPREATQSDQKPYLLLEGNSFCSFISKGQPSFSSPSNGDCMDPWQFLYCRKCIQVGRGLLWIKR